MMRRTMVLVVCCAFLSALFSISPVARAEDPAAHRQKHEQAAEETLKELGKKMDELAAETRKTGDQARDEMNSLYDEFKKQQVSAKKDLEEMRKATNETWDKAKVQMNKSIDDLNGIYERAKTGSKKEKESPDKAK